MTTRTADGTRPLLPTLLGLFFASGACGLVYQQLWLRELSLVFGVTVHAVATVLAAFFSGLALGSVLAGRRVDRTRRPLHWYGVIEVLVGGLALVLPAAFDLVENVYVGLAGVLPDSTAVRTGVRFVLSFVVLLVPATLLGASLPVVVKSSMLRARGLGERASLLYATNTAGAIVGTVASGFFLIGQLGVLASFRLAAVVNIAVGLVALVCSRAWERADAEVTPTPDPATADAAAAGADGGGAREATDGQRKLVLTVFGLSGFVTLALEVVWFRVLVLYLESNTYAFTIMLATVLAGIAVGSYAAVPVLRRVRLDRLRLLAAIEVGVGLAALASFWLLARSYWVADRARDLVDAAEGNLRFMLVASALAILPTTLLMGLAFPIALRVFAGRPDEADDDIGARVGLFYGVNVAGGIAGSLVAGFGLVPLLGARPSLVVLATLLVASGIALAWVAAAPRLRWAVTGGAAAVLVVGAALAVPDPYEAALDHRYPDDRFLWFEEGAQTTVAIGEQPDGTRVMYLDGLHQANDNPDTVRYHSLIGSLPMTLHPDPERALVIGLGGGVTAGAVSAFPEVEVDVVEVAQEVVEGAEFLDAVNFGVVDRANVDIRVDDGRNYLLTTDERYDVITADIILPEHAGAGKLWSVEYWELTRDALADDGIMLQWVTAHRSTAEYQMILRSFLRVYPHATLWADGSLLVGTKQPLRLDRADLEDTLADPDVAALLADVGFTDVDALLARYTNGPAGIRAFVGDGPLLTDDHPRIEYFRSLDVGPGPADLSGIVGGDVREVVRN
ncbi:MAG: fused MFS/spermidine synthase [Actinomycetota bacterium]